MGIFSSSSPFDQYVERATSEKNTGEDWAQIMDVCDRIKESGSGPKDSLKAISKRLNHDNPRVVLQTITLLDACVNNCGKKFLLEVASRDFEQEIGKQVANSKTHPKVVSRLRECLKKWAEGEFKGDPELGLIPALYNRLLKEGYDFESETDSTPKKTTTYSSDPNVVNNKQEEDDIVKAIQLSLQESGSSSTKLGQGHVGTQSLYGQASAVLSTKEIQPPEKDPLKVRAIYDFEAAEDNELTFKAGEIILVIDHSDPNWWKGSNHRGEGLFPATFVSKSLDDPDQKLETGGAPKKVSFSECVEVTEDSSLVETGEEEEVSGEINEMAIDQLVHLLHEADPTGERIEDPTLHVLEDQVNAMAPNIDVELERIDRKHAQLARMSNDLGDALNLYHQLIREMPATMPYYAPYNKGVPTGIPPMGQNMIPPGQFLPSNRQQMPPNFSPYPNMVSGPMPPYMVSTVGTSHGPTSYQQAPVSMSGSSAQNYSPFPPSQGPAINDQLNLSQGAPPPNIGMPMMPNQQENPQPQGGGLLNHHGQVIPNHGQMQHSNQFVVATPIVSSISSVIPPAMVSQDGLIHGQSMSGGQPSIGQPVSGGPQPVGQHMPVGPQLAGGQNIGPQSMTGGPQIVGEQPIGPQSMPGGPQPMSGGLPPPLGQQHLGPQQPHTMPSQGPQSMPMMSQGQPLSIASQAHPSSNTNLYSQPNYQNMQQPLL